MNESEWQIIKLPEPDFPCVPTDANSTYLGDAVYATQTDDGNVCLWTDREAGRHWMTLDARALRILTGHTKKVGML